MLFNQDPVGIVNAQEGLTAPYHRKNEANN